MRRNSKILTELMSLGILLAVCTTVYTGSAAAETPAQGAAVEAGLSAAAPEAPSAVLAASLEFSSSKAVEPAFIATSEPVLNFIRRPAPPTPAERWQRFLRRSFSAPALGWDAWDAAQAQFHHSLPGYGGGVGGFGKRYMAVVAGHTAGNFFGGYMFPVLLHQNPRSARLGTGTSFWHRLTYAATRVVVTRNDYGKETFNSSLFLSTVASRSVANLYFPREQRGFSASVSGIQGSLIDNVQGSLSREFMPDIHHFLWKHAPEFAKRIRRRVWSPAS